MLRTLAAMIVLWVLGQVAGAGEVYRWQDAQGNVHFGDRPPSVDTAETVPIKPSPGGAAAPQPDGGQGHKAERLLRAWEEERRIKQARQAEEQQRDAQRQRHCNQARDELRHVEDGWRFYRLDAQGERHYLSEDQLQERAAYWQAQVAQWCD